MSFYHHHEGVKTENLISKLYSLEFKLYAKCQLIKVARNAPQSLLSMHIALYSKCSPMLREIAIVNGMA